MASKMKKMKSISKGITAIALALVTAMGLIPGTDYVLTTYAAQSNKTTISGLCTGAIGNPTSGAGGWSYVYYGAYGGNAMKYRVLDKAATQFNTNATMLLDCNSMIINRRFDDDSKIWVNSEIKDWLNGDDFYGNTDVFTLQEKAAIASSTKGAAADGDGNGWAGNIGYAPLAGEHIFLLDAVEATSPSYGYANTENADANRSKSGTYDWWWLRSPCLNNTNGAGHVYTTGVITYGIVYYGDSGVSPAFNLDLQSIIFSSLISGSEYKLTIKDENMNIAQTGGSDITREGNVVTVPYTISGTNSGEATQVSVLLTDNVYTAGSVATSGYSYQKLNVTTWGTSGTGTFTLPAAYADRTCGTDYFAYILAEDVNDGTATDYASLPTSITIPAASSGTSASGQTTSPSGNNSNLTTGSSDSKPEEEPTYDYLDELRAKIAAAIALGGKQTVTWDQGTLLPYDIMKTLQDNPNITLVFSYRYLNKDYKVTLPGKKVKAYANIPFYGPLYLNTFYGEKSTARKTTKTKSAN